LAINYVDNYLGKLVPNLQNYVEEFKKRPLIPGFIKNENWGSLAFFLTDWVGGKFSYSEDAFDPRADEPEANCQKYACIIEAMGRELGLKTKLVIVDNDSDGNLTSHACASVDLNGKKVLLDPCSNVEYGTRHKNYLEVEYGTEIDLLEADSYMHRKEYGKAAKRLIKFLEKNPDSARCYNTLALCYNSMGKIKKAKKARDRAVEINPDFELKQIHAELPPMYMPEISA
jgi:tetratricopeptide (TPR) repeat protein